MKGYGPYVKGKFRKMEFLKHSLATKRQKKKKGRSDTMVGCDPST